MAPLAESLVEAETGLHPPGGPATIRVIDRTEWVQVNLATFRRLLEPLLERFAERVRAAGRLAAPQLAVTRRVSGVEIGLLLGWMSGRVLGQYDLLLADDDTDRDVVYVVGPNVAALERRHHFDPAQFRLWIALHELTHRAQFAGVPWMRDHYLALIREVLAIADPDPASLFAGLREAVRTRSEARQRFEEGGMVALFANDEQRRALSGVAGLMALLEGHGDVTMDRAGAGHVPDAARFARVLRERRRQTNVLGRFVQRLTGLEAKLAQYEAGERFIAEIERAAGPGAVRACWDDPSHLPTMEDIREPGRWLERVHPDTVPR